MVIVRINYLNVIQECGNSVVCVGAIHIILLHDWEGNIGKCSVRGWQY